MFNNPNKTQATPPQVDKGIFGGDVHQPADLPPVEAYEDVPTTLSNTDAAAPPAIPSPESFMAEDDPIEGEVVAPPKALSTLTEAEIEARLAQEAKALSDKMSLGTVPIISVKGKKFGTPDGSKFDTIRVVILDAVLTNTWYAKAYNPASKEKQYPTCFGVGVGQWHTEIKPHPDVEHKQCGNCQDPTRTKGNGCPHAAWGSHPTGTGRACSNKMKLAIVSADELENGVDSPTLATIEVPPSSLKTYRAFVGLIQKKHNSLPLRVITTLEFDPNSEFPRLIFKEEGLHSYLGSLLPLREQAQEVLYRRPKMVQDVEAEEGNAA